MSKSRDKKSITDKLKDTLERTGYISNIMVFQGEFHEDSRLDNPPYVSYTINVKDKNKDTKLHELERAIRYGFYDNRYPDCNITTVISEISEQEEEHTINVSFNGENKEDKRKRVTKMAIHLRKIIKEYHFKE